MQFAYMDSLNGSEMKKIRNSLQMTQVEFAGLMNVSNKTIERWESSDTAINGPAVVLAKLLKEFPKLLDSLVVPVKSKPLRLWYMQEQSVCSVIDVDERMREVSVYNYTSDIMARAFGKNENPSFEQYEEFLESRCFPRTRDKMKLMLKELDLPFYDPLMIIEKTQGRMAEDNFWIRIDRG